MTRTLRTSFRSVHVPVVVDQVRIEFLLVHGMLERAVIAFDLAEAEHVGLTHEDDRPERAWSCRQSCRLDPLIRRAQLRNRLGRE